MVYELVSGKVRYFPCDETKVEPRPAVARFSAAQSLGLTRQVIYQRLIKGWDEERAFTTPPQKHAYSDVPIGTVSGKLTTVSEPYVSGRNWMVRCVCQCGAECEKRACSIVHQRVKGCGIRGKHRKKRDKEKQRRQQAEMRKLRRDEIRSRLRKWKQDNPGLVAAYDVKRRAARMAKMALPEPERKAINAIYRLSKSHAIVPCYICGKETGQGERHVDHKIPVSKGGEHVAGNLAIACTFCNLSKSNRLLEEVA